MGHASSPVGHMLMLRDLRLRRREGCPGDGDGEGRVLGKERRDGEGALWHIKVDGDQTKPLPHVRDDSASGFVGIQLISWASQYHPDGHRIVLGGSESRRERQVAFSENLYKWRLKTARSSLSILLTKTPWHHTQPSVVYVGLGCTYWRQCPTYNGWDTTLNPKMDLRADRQTVLCTG